MSNMENEPIVLPLADCKIVALGWDKNENDFLITVLEPISHEKTTVICRWHNELDIAFRYTTDYGGMPLVGQAELLRQDGWLLLTIDCRGFPEGLLKLRCQEVQIGSTVFRV